MSTLTSGSRRRIVAAAHAACMAAVAARSKRRRRGSRCVERAVDEDRARVDDPALALDALGAGGRDAARDGVVERVDLRRSGELALEDCCPRRSCAGRSATARRRRLPCRHRPLPSRCSASPTRRGVKHDRTSTGPTWVGTAAFAADVGHAPGQFVGRVGLDPECAGAGALGKDEARSLRTAFRERVGQRACIPCTLGRDGLAQRVKGRDDRWR